MKDKKVKKVNLGKELKKLDVEDSEIRTSASNICVNRYYREHYYELKKKLKLYIETFEDNEERMAYIKTEKIRYN